MLHQLSFPPTFPEWQRAARKALAAHWHPDQILWSELAARQPLLDIASSIEPTSAPVSNAKVPREFLEIAECVACHADPQRWSVMYRILWRLARGESHVLKLLVDPEVQRLLQMDKAVRHEIHKMRAFVRFRAVRNADMDWYVAWFEPHHHIVELNAPFFVDRFANMHWAILTPDICAHWDTAKLSFTQGVSRAEAPGEDATEALWIRYYSHVFNPARVKVRAMEKEMPRRYWKNLPEASAIPLLLRDAPQRVSAMIEHSQIKQNDKAEFSAAPVPVTADLDLVRTAARDCRACPLCRHATQTVFGAGDVGARLVFVGEQPGDIEDRSGHPFVGPAGQLLNRALQETGIDRAQTYVTNAVKHFKWKPMGKRRLHQRPSSREVAACRPWLEAELRILKPQVLVCLGATAAQSVLERDVRVHTERGAFMRSAFCDATFITVHPSALLRAPDETARAADYSRFLDDLRLVADRLRQLKTVAGENLFA